jgi:cobalamin biosynthesis Mg chelatase CobN
VVKEKAAPGDYQAGTEVVIAAEEGGTADGNYTVQYYSEDMVGNREPAKELKVKIDTVVFLQLAKEEKQAVGKGQYLVEGKSEAGSKVTVNGEPATVSANGSFSAEVSLKAGGNKVTVQATDTAGNTASKTVEVTYNEPAAGTDMLMPLVAVAVAIAAGAGAGAFVWMRRRKK